MHSGILNSVVGIAGLLVVGALAGCTDGGDEGMLITKNVAPPLAGGACTFTGEASEPFLAHGAVDVHAEGYFLFPQFESRIIADVADDPSTMTQRTIIVTDADVDVSFPAGGLSGSMFTSPSPLVHFKELLSVPVAPNDGTSDGEIEVIHRELISAIVATNPTGDVEMLVDVTAHGTMSGQTVSSQKFEYPITLTNLVAAPIPMCPLPSGTIISQPGDSCAELQDEDVQCCSNSDGSLSCPATIATM
jgi:hypothetical protein